MANTEELQDELYYTVLVPKNLNGLRLHELEIIYEESVEALECFLRFDIFGKYKRGQHLKVIKS